MAEEEEAVGLEHNDPLEVVVEDAEGVGHANLVVDAVTVGGVGDVVCALVFVVVDNSLGVEVGWTAEIVGR